MERDEFGYAGGKPTWYIVIILLAMFFIIIGYGSRKFLPDISNWLKGGDPDRIQWSIEAPNR